MGAVTATFRVVSDEVTPAPVDGVAVRVFSDTDVFITEGVTGAVTPGSGEVELTLNGEVAGEPYIVRLAKDGWSFDPPTVSASVYDPPGAPPNNNIFEYTSHEGLVGQLVEIFTFDNEAVPNDLDGVRIRVYDSADLFLTEADTDGAGELSLVLPGAPDPGETYYLRIFKEGWTAVEGPTQTIAVLDPLVPPLTNNFEIHLDQPELDVSLDPKMCLLTGYLVDASGRGLKNVGIRFLPRLSEPELKMGGLPFPSDPTLLGNRAIVSEAHYVTDVNGKVQPLLPRGGIFDVLINGLETPGNQILEMVQIPDATSARLEDVLWPYVVGASYTPASVAITVDEEVDVEVSAQTSNGYLLEAANLGAFLEFSITDDTVAELTVLEGGALRLRGLQAGSTDIQVARVAGSLAPRLPAAPSLIVSPLIVTVT
jgi:hypothetical protein